MRSRGWRASRRARRAGGFAGGERAPGDGPQSREGQAAPSEGGKQRVPGSPARPAQRRHAPGSVIVGCSHRHLARFPALLAHCIGIGSQAGLAKGFVIGSSTGRPAPPSALIWNSSGYARRRRAWAGSPDRIAIGLRTVGLRRGSDLVRPAGGDIGGPGLPGADALGQGPGETRVLARVHQHQEDQDHRDHHLQDGQDRFHAASLPCSGGSRSDHAIPHGCRGWSAWALDARSSVRLRTL